MPLPAAATTPQRRLVEMAMGDKLNLMPFRFHLFTLDSPHSTMTSRVPAFPATRDTNWNKREISLRYAFGGPPPHVCGPHDEVVNVIVEAMQGEQGIDVPLLGRMAVVPVPGKKPKLIFHGAEELNEALAAS